MAETSSLDGIEVILLPAGKAYASPQMKFHAIPTNVAKHNGHYTESIIRKFNGSFHVGLKFPENFRLPSGTAKSTDATKALLLASGHHKRSGRNFQLTTDGLKWLHGRGFRADIRRTAAFGTITVFVSLHHASWKDGATSRYGSGGPALPSFGLYNQGDPLTGEPGKVYKFVFRPLAKAAYGKAADRYSLSTPALSPADSQGFVEDTEFAALRLSRFKKRKELCEEWEREQAAATSGPKDDQLVSFSTVLDEHSALPHPEVSEDPPSGSTTSARILGPSSKRPSDDASKSVRPAIKRGTPSKPVICACPLEHHIAPKRVQRSGGISKDSSTESAATAEVSSSAPRVRKNTETPDSEPDKKPQETVAIACTQCTQIKPAPRGKKIAFRQARGRFMYVPQDAPDDDEIEITAEGSQDPQFDEDDEEQLFHPDSEAKKLVSNSLAPLVTTTSADVPQPNENGVPLEVNREPQMSLTVLESEHRLEPIVEQAPASTVAEASDLDQAASNVSQLTPSPPSTEETVAQQHGLPSSSPVPNNDIVSQQAGASSGAVIDMKGLEEGSSQREQIVAPEQTSGDTPAHDLAASDPPATPQPSIGEISRKRSPTAHAEERPAKRQQVDVDLTIGEDDDLILVKKEMLESHERPSSSLKADLEEDELEARLKKVVVQQKQLELQLEEAELREKLKQLARRKGQRTSQQKAGVKIEIEID